jgi:hypothetical protein
MVATEPEFLRLDSMSSERSKTAVSKEEEDPEEYQSSTSFRSIVDKLY